MHYHATVVEGDDGVKTGVLTMPYGTAIKTLHLRKWARDPKIKQIVINPYNAKRCSLEKAVFNLGHGTEDPDILSGILVIECCKEDKTRK
jgi:hypothetical protein